MIEHPIKIEPHTDVIKILSNIIKHDTIVESDRGVSKDYFMSQIPPKDDLQKIDKPDYYTPITFDFMRNQMLMACAKLLGADECSNAILYHPHSIMEWHTNSDNAGTRIYYIYTEGESIFRYIDGDGNTIVDHDNIGWTVRRFTVPKDDLLWHTIWTEKKRYAFGFNIKDES